VDARHKAGHEAEGKREGNMLRRRSVVKGIAASAAAGVLTKSFPRPAIAADVPLKIGCSMPLTGAGFAAVGKLLGGAIKVYQAQHGDSVAGRKIELIIHDDSGNADNARRLVQDMIVNDKVEMVAMGITPCTLAVAPLVTEAKKATLCMSSGASITTTKSPYFFRVGFIIAPQAWICAEWAIKNGSKRVVTLVNEWAPGTEAEQAFKTRFTQLGGEVIESLRVPLASPDFAPPLQRMADLKPDSAFVYFPGPLAPVFTRQFAEKGLGQTGIKIFGPGDLCDDDSLDNAGDQMIGLITAGYYTAAHDSPLNKQYQADFTKLNGPLRGDFTSLGAYDGLHVIYEALKKTGGDADGDKIMAAVKGMAFESPRGPISVDPATRDIVSNIYMRKVEKIDGHLWAKEFETFPNVKDPLKS
jgi:branched-chain amino acid transport system substrate-binding protein